MDAYVRWLRGRVDGLAPELDILFDVLATTDYIPTKLDDVNRALDGQLFRREFAHDNPGYYIVGECSMLEFLVGVAKRLEDLLYDHTNPSQLANWFWVLMGNLGIEKGAVEAYNLLGPDDICEAVTKFLEGDYAPNGEFGGLFPIQNSSVDVTVLSVWEQMQLYLMEIPLNWVD